MPLADRTVANATAADPTGNTNGQDNITADGATLAMSIVNLSNGSSLSGTMGSGNTVISTDGNDNSVVEVTANGSNDWAYTPPTSIANSTTVNVMA